MPSLVCGLWRGCEWAVDRLLDFIGLTHNTVNRIVVVEYIYGVFTQLLPWVYRTTIHYCLSYSSPVILGFSSFSTSLIITTSWYKNNFFISSLCGKAAI